MSYLSLWQRSRRLADTIPSSDVISDAKYKRIEALLDLEKAATKA